MRSQLADWRALARGIDEFDLDALDPETRRMAVLVEGLGHSRVVDLGFGMGEAIIVATQRDPAQLRPLILAACEFTDDELRGAGRSTRIASALRVRREMVSAARDVVARISKTGPPDIAPT